MFDASKLIRLAIGPHLSKFYFFFRRNGLALAPEPNDPVLFDLIPYNSIRCINRLGRSSFFFKSNKSGYALVFADFTVGNATKWLDALVALTNRETEAREEVRVIDQGRSLPALNFLTESYNPNFNFVAFFDERAKNRNILNLQSPV